MNNNELYISLADIILTFYPKSPTILFEETIYYRKGIFKMNVEMELARLTKENDNFKKIIETQQNTIKKMVDYFILEKREGSTRNCTGDC